MWETQYGKFFISKKAYIDFCLSDFSATNTVIWKHSVDKSTNVRYDMILGRDLLTSLGLDLKVSKHIMIVSEVTYVGCSSPMVDVSNYNFTYITDKILKPEESFINSHVEKFLESEIATSPTHRMCIISDTKFKSYDLNTDMAE